MRHNHTKLLLMALFLALVPTAVASTTWYVNGVTGSDSNNCTSSTTACKTIGHAISLASSGDSIMVAAATYKENLTIAVSLRIVGSGATTTIIDGGGVGTVVTISNANAHVALSKLTVQHGHASGIRNEGGTLTISQSTISNNIVCCGNTGVGGGIYNLGTLTINRSSIAQNHIIYFCFPGHCNVNYTSGGGIYNAGSLTINNSTLSGNSVGFGGGGIHNAAKLTINNSTISGNSAFYGAGIEGYGTAAINNSTISGNGAFLGGGIFNSGCISGVTLQCANLTISNSTLSGNSATSGGGGGIYNSNTAKFQNTIIANNSGGNCSTGPTVTSKGYNLSSDGTCNFDNTGDRNNANPLLGTLGFHGGPTQTIPLLSGSPAIDAGNLSGCTNSNGVLLKTDQRGFPRPDTEDTGGCDMGAYERQSD